ASWSSLVSESKPHAELQLTRSRSLRQVSDRSGAGGDRREGTSRGAGALPLTGRHGHRSRIDRQLRVGRSVVVLDVENVEGFEAELQRLGFADVHRLEDREVEVDDMRAVKGIAPKVSERSRRHGKGTRIEPTGRSMN